MAGIVWASGYTAVELEDAQSRFRLTFPPDLLSMLRERRPLDGPDWNSETAVRPRLAWPFEGFQFDVENNGLWWVEWGERPNTAHERAEVLREVFAAAPRLIPVFSHRYMPETPSMEGNPIFSVYQSDVIHYGVDLHDYFEREDFGWDSRPWPQTVREIPFWSEAVRRNGIPPAVR